MEKVAGSNLEKCRTVQVTTGLRPLNVCLDFETLSLMEL